MYQNSSGHTVYYYFVVKSFAVWSVITTSSVKYFHSYNKRPNMQWLHNWNILVSYIVISLLVQSISMNNMDWGKCTLILHASDSAFLHAVRIPHKELKLQMIRLCMELSNCRPVMDKHEKSMCTANFVALSSFH